MQQILALLFLIAAGGMSLAAFLSSATFACC
jgi:hypothetical protein